MLRRSEEKNMQTDCILTGPRIESANYSANMHPISNTEMTLTDNLQSVAAFMNLNCIFFRQMISQFDLIVVKFYSLSWLLPEFVKI